MEGWETAVVLLLGLQLGILALAGVLLVAVRRRSRRAAGAPLEVAFFHPYATDMGGGERVLWVAMRELMAAQPRVAVSLYAFGYVDAAELRARVRDRFRVELPRAFAVRPLRLRAAVEATTWPRLTMAGQAAGAVAVALECVARGRRPDVIVDTLGLAFTYPVFRLWGCRLACYTHYPTIHADMVRRTARGWRGAARRAYFRLYAAAYGLAGRFPHVAMANSSWTAAHLRNVWQRDPAVVHPPVDTRAFGALPLRRGARDRWIVSVAQFRPEKDHALQLAAFAAYYSAAAPALAASTVLCMIGSCRNAEDEARVAALRDEAARLGVADHVRFAVNVPFAELLELLGRASVGLHTMWCEHFGIGVVELMAAGLVVVAHDSGGPRADIVTLPGRVGFLAASAPEYAAAFRRVLDEMSDDERFQIGRSAREHVAGAFSDSAFAERFLRCVAPLLKS